MSKYTPEIDDAIRLLKTNGFKVIKAEHLRTVEAYENVNLDEVERLRLDKEDYQRRVANTMKQSIADLMAWELMDCYREDMPDGMMARYLIRLDFICEPITPDHPDFPLYLHRDRPELATVKKAIPPKGYLRFE